MTNRPLLVVAALGVACLHSPPAEANRSSTKLASRKAVYIEVHGLDVKWDGRELGGYPALQSRCKTLYSQTEGAPFTVASGIDTSQSEIRRVVKILREDCGSAHYVAYDVLVRLGH
jgi:hypothetical protein